MIFFIVGGHYGFNLSIDNSKSSIDDLNLGNDKETNATYEKLKKTEEQFTNLGFNVFAADARAHGDSEGRY